MRRKRIRRVNKKNDSYLVMILLCLLVLNLGALVVQFVKNNNNFDDNFLEKVFLEFNNIKLFNKEEKIPEPILAEVENNIEDEDESKTSGDLIIDRLEEYESLIIIKDSTGISSTESIPKPLNINKISLNKDQDYILMYHTHGTEAYLAENEDVYNNEDTSKNMVSIGTIMEKVLEANGHRVDYVQTLHDLPVYNKSYTRSLNTIKSKKAENSNLKIFLDVHRDGVEKDAKYKDSFLKTARTKINGVSTATFSLVIGPDTPNYDAVLSFAKYIKAVSDTLYPNLCTGIIIKPIGKFNLYASDHTALLEIGSNLVTQEEAKETAKLVGEILSIVLDNLID